MSSTFWWSGVSYVHPKHLTRIPATPKHLTRHSEWPFSIHQSPRCARGLIIKSDPLTTYNLQTSPVSLSDILVAGVGIGWKHNYNTKLPPPSRSLARWLPSANAAPRAYECVMCLRCGGGGISYLRTWTPHHRNRAKCIQHQHTVYSYAGKATG